jgi:hypothetical protein
MGNIYKSAKSVLVWLGEQIDGVEALFEAIRSILLPTMKPIAGLLSPQPNKEEFLQFEARVKLLKSIFYDRLWIICERPWFCRAWVLQEVALNAEATISVDPTRYLSPRSPCSCTTCSNIYIEAEVMLLVCFQYSMRRRTEGLHH